MTKLLLILVFCLGLVLRLYQVSKVPVSVYWDEAAIGYNAYTISSYFKDEYGNFLPLFFRSFDDYKFPGQIYLTAPFVKVIGLSELAVRLPSVMVGSLTVLALFFLVKEMTKSNKLSLMAAFFLSISTWHLQFSRPSFEASGALLFQVLGIWLVLKLKKTNPILGILAFVTSLYFYRSALIVTPILLVLLLVIYRPKKMLLSLIVFGLLALPIYYGTFLGKAQVRGNQVIIFQDFQSKKKVEVAKELVSGYFVNYSYDFFFQNGDPNSRHHTPGFGELWVWQLPLIILGLVWTIRRRSKFGFIAVIWCLVGPLPAAIAVPSPHALRSLSMLPAILVLVALGTNWLKRYAIILPAFVVFFLYQYLNSYYFVMPRSSAADWGDGYKQLVASVSSYSDYDKVIVSGYRWQPYIYFLFYGQHSPNKYIFGATGWDTAHPGIDLSDTNLRSLVGQKNTLVALSPEEYTKQDNYVSPLSQVKDINGQTVYIIGKLK